jgi:hypothetical protein
MEMASQRLGFLVASGVLVLIGLLLIVLWPRKQPAQQANAAAR